MFYDLKIIKFDLIIYDIINKERYMLIIKKNNDIMFVYHNNKNK